MAKVDTQSIPSEKRIIYKRAAQIATTLRGQDYVRSRFPWRLPQMQEGGAGVKPAQQTNRDRFKYAKNKYALLSAAGKARWAAANPEYNSYLFGYNFFMLEGLMGGGPTQYPQMIKSIQVHKASVPTSGGHTFTLSPSIDGTKGVVLIQGSARKVPKVIRGTGTLQVAGSVFNLGDTIDPDKCTVRIQGQGSWGYGDPGAVVVSPYIVSLSSTQISIDWSREPDEAVDISWEVVEHVEGVVHPVLVSISNTEVAVDWAEEPDTAADVSITAVEYL
jgi:hypothetical protein